MKAPAKVYIVTSMELGKPVVESVWDSLEAAMEVWKQGSQLGFVEECEIQSTDQPIDAE